MTSIAVLSRTMVFFYNAIVFRLCGGQPIRLLGLPDLTLGGVFSALISGLPLAGRTVYFVVGAIFLPLFT